VQSPSPAPPVTTPTPVQSPSPAPPVTSESKRESKLKKGFEAIDEFKKLLSTLSTQQSASHTMTVTEAGTGTGTEGGAEAKGGAEGRTDSVNQPTQPSGLIQFHRLFRSILDLLKDEERAFRIYFRTQGALTMLLEHSKENCTKALHLLEQKTGRIYPDTEEDFEVDLYNDRSSDKDENKSENKNENESTIGNDKGYRSVIEDSDSEINMREECKAGLCKMIIMELTILSVCAEGDSAVKMKMIEMNMISTVLLFLSKLETRHRHTPCCNDVKKGSDKVNQSTTLSQFQSYKVKQYDVFIKLVSSVVEVLLVCCADDCDRTRLLISKCRTVLPSLCGIMRNELYLLYSRTEVKGGVRTRVRAGDVHCVDSARLMMGAAEIVKAMTFKCPGKYCVFVRAHMCVSLSMCLYLCVRVCVCVCMHVCMYLCMHACMHVCMCVCMYVCMYVCMFVCMYVCACIYLYVFVCLNVCVRTPL
jgi:hypothetical protein